MPDNAGEVEITNNMYVSESKHEEDAASKCITSFERITVMKPPNVTRQYVFLFHPTDAINEAAMCRNIPLLWQYLRRCTLHPALLLLCLIYEGFHLPPNESHNRLSADLSGQMTLQVSASPRLMSGSCWQSVCCRCTLFLLLDQIADAR